MTPLQTLPTSALATWRASVAFWSEVAKAPSRVARTQAQVTLRLWQAAQPWPAARPASEVPGPVAEAATTTAVAEASAVDIVAATASSEEGLAEPAEIVPAAEVERVEPVAMAEPSAKPEDLGSVVVLPPRAAAKEPVLALAGEGAEVAPKAARPARPRGPSAGARTRKPRRG